MHLIYQNKCWNSYFDAMIYLNDADLQPLQLVLRSILVQNTPQPGMIADIQSTAKWSPVSPYPSPNPLIKIPGS